METTIAVLLYVAIGFAITGLVLNDSDALTGLPLWMKVVLRVVHIALWFPLTVLFVAAILLLIPLKILFED